ncbi:hypothetical protein I302_104336 [Kwoniella bestiolae CBS 10118]|uniref:SH3 domain-containing protein n=1 Tax=Kwoniella bestiolae CBS 10118 TaxID=1296100 RepID=A0A1B9GB13_9TREE|nr:hypothetical protein I302_03044 [Kwoniella bestiolae CBS 10118]OCF28192.1 hypothetical protein I302_03044 [Kwoniella bestiolae CBS 10118]
MVFANLTYEAFFTLLDEYFESRPHLAPSSSSSNGPSLATLTKLIPPSRSPNPPTPSSPHSPVSTTAGGNGGEQQDMAQRFISSSIKLGTKGTKSGIGAISKNKDAMDLLGKVGAAGVVRGADKRLNSPPPVDGGATIEEVTVVSKPAAPPSKKGGVAGLVSGRSFGHVDTSSKMSAFTSMWKDPQKAQPPTVEHHMPPALSNKHTSMPPPIRRDGSGTSARSPAHEVEVQQPQAQALYDYAGSDTTDLNVQANQIVNLIEKTSADWWTCEDGNGTRGLVPATYLKEL